MTAALAKRDRANTIISPSPPEQIDFNPKTLKKLKAGYVKDVKTVADALSASPELRMASQAVLLATAVASYTKMKESKTPLRPVDPAKLKVKGGKVIKNPGSRKGGNKFWPFVCKKISQANKARPKKDRKRGDFHREASEYLNNLVTRHRFKKMYIESDEFQEMDEDKKHNFIKEHMESDSFKQRTEVTQQTFMQSAERALNPKKKAPSKPDEETDLVKKKSDPKNKKKARSKPAEETDMDDSDSDEGE